ncbi:MAG: hypothetical protein ACFE96_07060 [Candidatus Hermodarchaeota archaeon]
MGKDQRLEAKKQLTKADQLYNAKQFKKAGKTYHLAGNVFLKLNDFEEARDCFIKSAKTFIILERYDTSVELFRQSAEACLIADKFLAANQIYREAINYVPKLRSEGDKYSNFITYSVLSYLCLFLKGNHEEGLEYLKRIQKKVDKEFFKENPLIQLVSEITISLRDGQIKYVDKIKDNLGRYKLREAETKLLKYVLLLLNIKLSLGTTFELDKELYTTNDAIELALIFDTSKLLHVLKDSYYQFDFRDFIIKKILVNLSDNLTTSKKPLVPFAVDAGKSPRLDFTFKPHFVVDNPIIGPLLFTCELNENLIFIYETQTISPKLISPPATLLASIKNLRPPLIDQTFPLEITIDNKSEGEALDVNIDVEFPEHLKIMRGTTKKQIYSLRTNEDLKWEINLKPLEAGDYIIKINIKFTDPNQNIIEEIKEFPFSIKL